jgi:hypothetical protein
LRNIHTAARATGSTDAITATGISTNAETGTGDFGPYWEDGYGPDAAHTAVHRENQHRIPTGEVMGTAVSAIDPWVKPDRSMLNNAWWNELIYDEHTWT